MFFNKVFFSNVIFKNVKKNEKACKVEPCTLIPYFSSLFLYEEVCESNLASSYRKLGERWKIMRKQCDRFHFACMFLLIFHAKLLRFIYTRISATFAGLFQYCISRLYYL